MSCQAQLTISAGTSESASTGTTIGAVPATKFLHATSKSYSGHRNTRGKSGITIAALRVGTSNSICDRLSGPCGRIYSAIDNSIQNAIAKTITVVMATS